jgi:hypothetical protein
MDHQVIMVVEVTMETIDLEAEAILVDRVAGSTEGEGEAFIQEEVIGEDTSFSLCHLINVSSC